jgi:hypothetical protein
MRALDFPRRGLSVASEAVLHGLPRYVWPLLREVISRPPMREILPGLHHWTAIHPRIRQPVSSYFFEPAQVLIDPLIPREGIEWFNRHPPRQIVLSNRHHYRESGRFVEEFACGVRCSKPGLHEFEDGPTVDGFEFGEELAPGVIAVEVGAICPDDTALHFTGGNGALLFADALVRPGGALSFVPDFLMGDDPKAVKEELVTSLGRLLELPFDSLLFAHGDPLVGGGKAALREFVDKRRS